MANDLATLNAALDTQLADGDNSVWASAEKDSLLTWAVAGLWPRLARELDPTSYTVTLVTADYFYAVSAALLSVNRVDWLDTDNTELGPLPGGTWEILGNLLAGTAQIHVAPAIVEQGGTLRLLGYGRYDVATNLIPDDYVALVLAIARAEALRRLVGNRARFKQWLSRQQTQNTTVNELILMVNEADAEAKALRSMYRTWRRPVPGRIG